MPDITVIFRHQPDGDEGQVTLVNLDKIKRDPNVRVLADGCLCVPVNHSPRGLVHMGLMTRRCAERLAGDYEVELLIA